MVTGDDDFGKVKVEVITDETARTFENI